MVPRDDTSAAPPPTAKPSGLGLAITVLGLLLLVALPSAVWWRSDRYHRRIDQDTDPAQQQIAAAVRAADRARSTAFYYLFTLDASYAQEYGALTQEWRAATADDSAMERCGASVAGHWGSGKRALDRWFALYGARYIRTGEQQDLPEADRLFRVGEAHLRDAGTQADRLSATLREKASGVSQAEAAVTALMAAICLAIAALAWRDARIRSALWQSERDAASRLQLAVTETNHRVKNNLQVVAALIEMRIAEHDAAVPLAELHDVVRQVKAVAAVHDFLSHELQSDAVSAAHVLQRLVELGARTAGLQARVCTAGGTLTVKQATAVALITNELLLNAGKHGATRADVSMAATGGEAALRVADDGPGFPPDFDPQRHGNVGIALVCTLAQHDLGGAVRFASDGGAIVDVTFPLDSGAAPPAEGALTSSPRASRPA